jgi:hypothetical protein
LPSGIRVNTRFNAARRSVVLFDGAGSMRMPVWYDTNSHQVRSASAVLLVSPP